jgi:predicted phage terminase large subunit-like protein
MNPNDQIAVRAEACRRSFFRFLQEFWDLLITEKPVYNWHIPFICSELEIILWHIMARRPKPYDLVVNVPPGTTKTTLISIAFPAWAWIARMPVGFCKDAEEWWAGRAGPDEDPRPKGWDLRFIAGSYAGMISLFNSVKSRDLIESDRYQQFFPEITLRREMNAKGLFMNSQNGSRFTTSVGGQYMGQHAHGILIDDPIDSRESESEAARLAANRFMANIMTRVIDKQLTPLILVMQRLHENDPTAKVLKDHGSVRHIRLPATDDYEVYPPEVKKYYVNGMLDPVRINKQVLADQERILGSYGFAGQYGQDPRPRKGGMFERGWFEIVDNVPDGGIEVRGWDLAASKKKQGAKGEIQPATVGIKMKLINPRVTKDGLVGGTIYITGEDHFYGQGAEVRKRMRACASQDGKRCVISIPQDPGQAGKDQVQDLVANLHGYNVKYSLESGDKVVRATPFSAQCEAGNVKLLRGHWNEAWLNEMTMFPNGRKDRCDSCVRTYNQLISEARFYQSFEPASLRGVGASYKPVGGAYEQKI